MSGGSTCYAVTLAVVDEDVRRVEAHRLGVEERAEELGRVVGAQPGGLVGEQAEGGGVAFGKPNSAKPAIFWKTRSATGFETPCASAPVDELLLELLDRLARALAAHRAAQALGLAGAEPGERHRHLQHLLLVEDDAERLGQRRLQARVVVT